MTESPTVSSFAPLRRRAFRIVWIGALISNVGSWMQAASLGYYTANLTGSAGWSAAVAAAEFAPTALLGPIGGALADRLPRKLVVLAMTITQGLLAGLLTWAMIFGSPGAPMLFMFALANGCSFALGFPSSSALLPELVPPEEIGAAVGLSSASWNLGRVVGPLLGTLLYQQIGLAWVLAINTLSFVAVGVSLLTISIVHTPRTPSPLFASIREGFRYVSSTPSLRVNAQALCLNTLFVAPFIGLIPAMVEKELGGGKQAVGWLITGQGLGAVITGLTFGKLVARYGPRRVMLGSITGGPLAVILYALSPSWEWAVVPILVCGALYFGALSSFSTVSNLQAPSELRGRVLSLNQVILGAVYAVSLNVEGQLGDRLGLRQVAIGGAVLGLVVLLVIRTLRPGYSASLDPPEAVVSPS